MFKQLTKLVSVIIIFLKNTALKKLGCSKLMKPFRDYDLNNVIRIQWAAAYEKIDSMSNEEIMANDLDILADNIYQEFFIEPVEIFEEDFSKRSIKQGKIKRYIEPFWRDYSNKEYVDVDGIIGDFYFPFQGDSDLFRCRASTFSLSGYPEITIQNSCISFRIEKSLDEMKASDSKERVLAGLKHSIDSIRSGVEYANKDVLAFNQGLRSKALVELQSKRDTVQAFFDIANMFEVPIEKKEYAKKHIPLVRNIAPVAKKYDREDYYGIKGSDYIDILETIKHTASTYERTPASYKSMYEEDLRNTLLAALNATYKGDATGETFRNKGKTDICIEQKNRAAFVAECKMWTGQAEVAKAVSQLDSYLTWRDYKTALIYFVRRKDFLKILETVESALKAIDCMKNVHVVDKNEFECLFLSKQNLGQQIHLRVMLFNLYC